jgi:hypothetical protein
MLMVSVHTQQTRLMTPTAIRLAASSRQSDAIEQQRVLTDLQHDRPGTGAARLHLWVHGVDGIHGVQINILYAVPAQAACIRLVEQVEDGARFGLRAGRVRWVVLLFCQDLRLCSVSDAG